jgi:hypothetical protein
MVIFLIGVAVGAIIGFFSFALMSSASMTDREDERRRAEEEQKRGRANESEKDTMP